jgi:hypothetical protein
MVAALVGTVTLGAVSFGGLGPGGSGGPHRLAVTDQFCAAGWRAARSGPLTFEVTNRTAGTVDVQLVRTATPRVLAEIPTLGPGTTLAVAVTIGPGWYSWECTTTSGAGYASDPQRVTGPAVVSSPGFVPVTPAEMAPAVTRYRASVTAGLVRLASATDALVAAVDAGDLPAAEQRWLVAHLDYERLGAAYGTFGAYATEIDGRPDGQPGGVHDPRFTGFLRLEYGLWHRQDQVTLAAVAGQLDGFVHGLVDAFPHQVTPPSDLALRTHEILENALQFELTGATDEGSHTNLASVLAAVQGTQMTLSALSPLLATRDPQLLATAHSGLDGLATSIERSHFVGGWAPVETLATGRREQVDASVGALLETLSAVPGTLQMGTG